MKFWGPDHFLLLKCDINISPDYFRKVAYLTSWFANFAKLGGYFYVSIWLGPPHFIPILPFHLNFGVLDHLSLIKHEINFLCSNLLSTGANQIPRPSRSGWEPGKKLVYKKFNIFQPTKGNISDIFQISQEHIFFTSYGMGRGEP